MDPGEGWHDARVTPYGPLTPRPRDRGPALRAGDLRGHEGLPARRRLDLDVPPGGQRRADGALEPPARAPGAPARRLRRRPSRPWSSVDRRWVPESAGRRASTSDRSCSPPRRSSASGPAQHVTFMVIASPAGAYFSKGVKPITLWLTTEYTRAGRGGMGAAKTGGNYAVVARRPAGGHGPRLRPGGLPRRPGAPVRRGARRHEHVLRLRRRPHRHPGATARSSRASPAPASSSSPARSATRSRSAGSPSTSGVTGVTSGEIIEVFACGTAAVVTPVGCPKWDGGQTPESAPRRRGDHADPPGAGRHPVRPRGRHVRLDAQGRLRPAGS